uniref:Uncharacterized protein n=1 Tax=Tanacetum cinerariifolium TaxID=118510 RepID=A0A699GHX0_TANCI|nr:hypothetical protein [Tanacetum cinerariifolium]
MYRVPVPLPEGPYEAIRHAYLVRTNTESEPFEGEARTPESHHILAPPTCHVEESEGSGTSGARSASSDSIAPLSPDHPFTHTTPVLVLILQVAAMSNSAFRKRFRSSYNSSPSLTLPVKKRYRGTSELILGTDSKEDEEVDESLDSDSESEDVEDEGPTVEDEDPAIDDDGLVVGIEGPSVDDKSYGLDGESHGVDDESYGLDDESYGIGEVRGIESDGLGLREEDVVPEGQQRAVSIVGTTVSEPLRLGYSALRRRELALEEDHVHSTFETLPSPEWTSGSLPISPSPFVVHSPVSSLMIPLTLPSPIALPMATSAATILIDEDQFIMERTAVTFGALWRPVLALEAWVGRVDTRMADMSWTGVVLGFSVLSEKFSRV